MPEEMKQAQAAAGATPAAAPAAAKPTQVVPLSAVNGNASRDEATSKVGDSQRQGCS